MMMENGRQESDGKLEDVDEVKYIGWSGDSSTCTACGAVS